MMYQKPPGFSRGFLRCGRKGEEGGGVIFYVTYKDNEKLAPMVREIGWIHKRNLLFTKEGKLWEKYGDKEELLEGDREILEE